MSVKAFREGDFKKMFFHQAFQYSFPENTGSFNCCSDVFINTEWLMMLSVFIKRFLSLNKNRKCFTIILRRDIFYQSIQCLEFNEGFNLFVIYLLTGKKVCGIIQII